MLPDRTFLYGMPPSRSQPPEKAEPTRFFKIKAVVSSHRVLGVADRTTRVFKVVEVISKDDPTVKPDKEFILKDVWIDVNAKTEAAIQEELLGRIEDFVKRPGGWKSHPLLQEFHNNEETLTDALVPLLENRAYTNLFLIVDAESIGLPCKSVHEDAWDPDDVYCLYPCTAKTEAPPSPDAKATTRPPKRRGEDPPSTCRAFAPKRRCLFLYEDVCERVSCLPTLGDAFDVLRQANLGTFDL